MKNNDLRQVLKERYQVFDGIKKNADKLRQKLLIFFTI